MEPPPLMLDMQEHDGDGPMRSPSAQGRVEGWTEERVRGTRGDLVNN
jgi:hypothetical protein